MIRVDAFSFCSRHVESIFSLSLSSINSLTPFCFPPLFQPKSSTTPFHQHIAIRSQTLCNPEAPNEASPRQPCGPLSTHYKADVPGCQSTHPRCQMRHCHLSMIDRAAGIRLIAPPVTGCVLQPGNGARKIGIVTLQSFFFFLPSPTEFTMEGVVNPFPSLTSSNLAIYPILGFRVDSWPTFQL